MRSHGCVFVNEAHQFAKLLFCQLVGPNAFDYPTIAYGNRGRDHRQSKLGVCGVAHLGKYWG